MKHLKIFEEYFIPLSKPEEGDFVVANWDKFKDSYQNFLLHSIGVISKVYYNGEYEVLYDPKGILPEFNSDNLFIFTEEQILYWSRNKKNCEKYLATKKYNL